MTIETVKVADIQPAAYNPRKELKEGDPEYESLKKSVQKFGLAVPLIINQRTGNLISGHQRLNILKEEGIEEAEACIVDMDEQSEKILNVSLNKIYGDWDEEKLKSLLEEIPEEDIEFTGFSEQELDEIFSIQEPGPDDWQDEGTADEQTEYEGEDEEETITPYTVYISFSTKESAEKWLQERGINQTYDGGNKNITIHMEGADYGTGN